MTSDKKDLTRIEDLGEFIHELNEEEDFNSDLPDLPSDEDDSFKSEETEAFGEEESSRFDSFNSDTETDFSPEENPFSSEESSFSSENDPFNSNTLEEDPFSTSEDPSSFDSSEDQFSSSFSEETGTELSDSTTWDAPEEDSKEEAPVLNAPEITETFSFSEPDPEPVSTQDPLPPLEEIPVVASPPVQEYRTETFDDLKKFSESSSFTGTATEANPSFSVLLKNVRFIEDINDIVSLLRELNLLVDSEEQTRERLMRGTLLVPRISEYAAIFLAHKLRRFDMDIQVGLSDEIHPPKHKEAPETGIVSKHSLYQNQGHHFHFDDPKIDISQIIVAATPTLEGYQVIRYMGIASEHKMLDSQTVEDESSSEVPRHYQELAQKLKAHALKNNSNAVVGLNYQLTPIPTEYGVGHKYRLTCTGNLVWVNKL